MALDNNAKNSMLDHLATEAVYASLHTGTPATTGNEVTGGTPAYARKAITWNSASSGAMTLSNTPAFDVPSGTTIYTVGFFSAVTDGTFYGFDDVTQETFAGQGTYTVTSGEINLNA